MLALDGKVAIVTGAGRLRGIGRAAAVAFAELGANVVVTGTGRDPATFPADEKAAGWRDVHSTVEQVEAAGPRGLPLVVDVSNEEQVRTMVDRTLEEFGRGFSVWERRRAQRASHGTVRDPDMPIPPLMGVA